MNMKVSFLKTGILLQLFALVLSSCTKEEILPPVNTGAEVRIEKVSSDNFSLKVRIVPDETATGFEYGIGTPSDYESFLNGTISGYKKVDGCEPVEVVFDNLDDKATYTVYARAYLDDVPGAVASKDMRTLDENFKVTSQFVHVNSASFKIESNTDYAFFKYYLGRAEDREKVISGGVEMEKAVSGIDGYTCVNFLDLDGSDREYVFYAYGYDRMNMPTELYEIPITLCEPGSVPDAEFSIESLDLFRGQYRVTPSGGCPKVTCILYPAGENDLLISNNFNNDLFYWMTSWEKVPDIVHSFCALNKDLEFKLDDNKFQAGIEMEAYILIYDEDYNPVGVKKQTFSKPTDDQDVEDAVVTVEIKDITEKGATYVYTADDNTLGFMYDTVDADWFDDFKETSEYHSTYIHEMMFEAGKYWAYSGELDENMQREFTEDTGTSQTRYYAAACPMNMNGPGAGWCELVLKEYTTK